MTIDERLEAIAMNLERLSHRVEDGRREHDEWRRGHEELVKEQTARSAHDMAALRENINSLVKSVAQMVMVAQTHDRHLSRLEHHGTN